MSNADTVWLYDSCDIFGDTLDVWYCCHRSSCQSGVRRVGSVVSVVITGDKALVVVVLVKDVV